MKPYLEDLIKEQQRLDEKKSRRALRDKNEPDTAHEFYSLTLSEKKNTATYIQNALANHMKYVEKTINTYLEEAKKCGMQYPAIHLLNLPLPRLHAEYKQKNPYNPKKTSSPVERHITSQIKKGRLYDAIFIEYTNPTDLDILQANPLQYRIAFISNTPDQIRQDLKKIAGLEKYEVTILSELDIVFQSSAFSRFLIDRIRNKDHNSEDLADITNTFLYSGPQASPHGPGNKAKIHNSGKDCRDEPQVRGKPNQKGRYRP